MREASPQKFQSWLTTSLLLILLLGGLGLRLLDLTDPPLDFHPAGQLRSAATALSQEPIASLVFQAISRQPRQWQALSYAVVVLALEIRSDDRRVWIFSGNLAKGAGKTEAVVGNSMQ